MTYTLQQIIELQSHTKFEVFSTMYGGRDLSNTFEDKLIDGADVDDVLLFTLWVCLYQSNKNVIIATPSSNANLKDYILYQLRDIFYSIPELYRIPIKRFTKDVIEFENGNRIFLISRPHGGRGKTVDHLIISKQFSPQAFDEMRETLIPCINFSRTNAKLIYFL
jgi:hypothetical protein